MPMVRITTVDGTVVQTDDPARLQEEVARYKEAAFTLIDDLKSGDASRVRPAMTLYSSLNERHSALTSLLAEFERRRADEELIEEGQRVAAELERMKLD